MKIEGNDSNFEIMRNGINATINNFCVERLTETKVGSFKKRGSAWELIRGATITYIILSFDIDIDSWVIFVGDTTKPVIRITASDELIGLQNIPESMVPNDDIMTLYQMLLNSKDLGWMVDTLIEPTLPKAFSQDLIKDGKRPSKIGYYLAMAEVASTRGTCIRRRFGAIIVKDDRIVSTGYVGAPSGRSNCCDIGNCFREKNNIPSGTMYEKCRSVHAEMNAVLNASKEEMKDSTLYLVGVEPDGTYTNADCCSMCKRVIINSGIKEVVIRKRDGGSSCIPVESWVNCDDSLDINHTGY